MVISRVFPALIRLKHAIKLNTIAQKNFSNYSEQSLKKLSPGAIQRFQFKNMSTDVDKDLNDPKRHFDYEQLIDKKDKDGAVIIDVREHAEINETGKIPGSIHIPLNDLEKALSDMSEEDFLNTYNSPKPRFEDEIIFTCRSGRRSLTAMRIAYQLEYLKAGNYKGGWLDWAEKSRKSN